MTPEITMHFGFADFNRDIARLDSGEISLPTVTSVKIFGDLGVMDMIIYIDENGEVL